MIACDLEGGLALLPGDGLVPGRVSMAEGLICAEPVGRRVDASGFLILPGIVDAHGDGFEHHVAPRRGVTNDIALGLRAAEAEMAAQGITTGVVAQFMSWEGGLRGAEFADRVFEGLRAIPPGTSIDLIRQLRFEIGLLDEYAALPARLADWGVRHIVFNDHLPHERLAQGRNPPRLTGQALRAGRSPEAHLAMMQDIHARFDEVPGALDTLCQQLQARGIWMGSHDDRSAEDRRIWRARGVVVAEFPETRAAAEAARAGGDRTVLGAPNLVRGASQRGNVSARDLVSDGLCDALASDYHYPAPRRAALWLVDQGLSWTKAWGLVSEGPARVLGLHDRGQITAGMRADLVILEADSRRVAASFARGRVRYLNGDFAERLMG